MNTASQNELLKQAADDFRLAKAETDGLYRGALIGMRSVFTFTEHETMEQYVNQLLDQLKREKSVD